MGSEVEIRPYDAIFEEIAALSESVKPTDENRDSNKWLVSNRASWALVNALGGYERVEITRSPIEDSKAIKNETELKGMRSCHIRDGAALIEYFAWLEDQLSNGFQLDEVDAAERLEAFRKQVHLQLFKLLRIILIHASGPKPTLKDCHLQPSHRRGLMQLLFIITHRNQLVQL